MWSTCKQPGTCLASLILLLAAVVWEHGKIPVEPACDNGAVQQLPPPLRALFTAPTGWLKQLTPVKLICLARACQKLQPGREGEELLVRPGEEGEELLVQMMEAAIEVHASLSKQETTALQT